MSRYGPSFTAASTRQLARYSLMGDTVTVVLTGDVVGLVGASGGDRPIPLDKITGLRAGLIQGRPSTRSELRIYVEGEAEPLHLYPVQDRADAAAGLRSYSQFVQGLAARLVSAGKLAGLETGSGKVWAAISTALLVLPAIAMTAVFISTVIVTLPDAERWIARAITGTGAVGLLWLCIWWWRAHWPRRIRRLSDLDRMLRDP